MPRLMACVARESVIRDFPHRAFPRRDHFPELRKMISMREAICIKAFSGSMNGFFKIFPFLVFQECLQLSSQPILLKLGI